MAKPLQFSLIKRHVAAMAEDEDIHPTRAFLRLVLGKRFGLTEEEIDDAITDGSGDFGIDAIVIDEDSDSRPEIFIIQSKYYENKANRSFPRDELKKLTSSIEEVLLGEAVDPKELREELRDKRNYIQQLVQDKTPRFIIMPISNSEPPTEAAIGECKKFCERQNEGDEFFQTEYLHTVEIARLLAPEKTRTIDINLALSGKHFDYNTGNARALVGRIPADRLAKLRDKEGFELFDKNVRGFLGLGKSARINRRIAHSATSPDSSLFFLLNNGITIICKKMSYPGGFEDPNVELKDMQIVNGGQTTNALFDAYREGGLKPDVHVLVKIIETEDDELISKITEATNSQNPVSARDLRSNDQIQKDIESYLETQGYYYEARKNKFQGKKPSAKRVDAEKAAQAYYAFAFTNPADAKNKKRQLFGEKYFDIFNDSLDPERFLFAYQLYEKVRKLTLALRRKKGEGSGYGFLRDAMLTTLAMFRFVGIDEPEYLKKSKKIDEEFQKIIESTKEVVAEAIAEQGSDKYSNRAFFIHPDTLGRIEEKYKDLYL